MSVDYFTVPEQPRLVNRKLNVEQETYVGGKLAVLRARSKPNIATTID